MRKAKEYVGTDEFDWRMELLRLPRKIDIVRNLMKGEMS